MSLLSQKNGLHRDPGDAGRNGVALRPPCDVPAAAGLADESERRAGTKTRRNLRFGFSLGWRQTRTIMAGAMGSAFALLIEGLLLLTEEPGALCGGKHRYVRRSSLFDRRSSQPSSPMV